MNPLLDIDARTDLGAIEPGHVRSGIPALPDGQRRALAALCDAPTPCQSRARSTRVGFEASGPQAKARPAKRVTITPPVITISTFGQITT